MAVNIAGGAEGMGTIRNVSLLKRSLDKTMRRLAPDAEENQAAETFAEPGITEHMRAQVGTLTKAIRQLEDNAKKNQAAEDAISDLREKLLAMREVAIAATDQNPGAEDRSAAYQEQIDQLADSFNRSRNECAYDGQRLLDGTAGSVVHISILAGFEVSDPSRAKEAIGKIEETRRGLDRALAAVGVKAREEYEESLRSLEVSSQNIAAAESLIRDSAYASEHAKYTRQIIELNAGAAALAQGNLWSEAVFKLLHT